MNFGGVVRMWQKDYGEKSFLMRKECLKDSTRYVHRNARMAYWYENRLYS